MDKSGAIVFGVIATAILFLVGFNGLAIATAIGTIVVLVAA
tara:strand:+ start:465 stop:587 length:123 start_codon:yes stop_codon:yes gene_type:complete